MSGYGRIPEDFWTRDYVRALRGDAAALAVLLHVRTSRHGSPIGVFYLPAAFVAHETGLAPAVVATALARLGAVGFAQYDAAAETVFVPDMGADEIGPIHPGDKRVGWVRGLVADVRHATFAASLRERYAAAWHLAGKPAENPASTVAAAPTSGAPAEPLRSPIEGASKPPRRRSRGPSKPSASSAPSPSKTPLPPQPPPAATAAPPPAAVAVAEPPTPGVGGGAAPAPAEAGAAAARPPRAAEGSVLRRDPARSAPGGPPGPPAFPAVLREVWTAVRARKGLPPDEGPRRLHRELAKLWTAVEADQPLALATLARFFADTDAFTVRRGFDAAAFGARRAWASVEARQDLARQAAAAGRAAERRQAEADEERRRKQAAADAMPATELAARAREMRERFRPDASACRPP